MFVRGSGSTVHTPGEEAGVLSAGTTLNERYELMTEIGRGSAGTVWAARDTLSSETCAIKVLRAARLPSLPARKRFVREVETTSALRHPHCVEVIGHGFADDGSPFLVMEHLHGKTLASLLREQGALPPARAIAIISQILDGVGAAHRLNIVHRDLKPGNVMLIRRDDHPEFVKVCDFGLAKNMDSDGVEPGQLNGVLDAISVATAQGEICGTPEYMAPEQARDEAVDARADLYAIGVMLFQMIVGELPFQARSPLAIISLHLSAAPPRPSSVRPDLGIFPPLENLILRSLAKDRAERPSSAQVFRADLLQIARDYLRHCRATRVRSLLGQTTLSGTLTDTPAKSSEPSATRLFRGVAATVGVGVLGLAIGTWQGARDPEPLPAPSTVRVAELSDVPAPSSATTARSAPAPAPSVAPAPVASVAGAAHDGRAAPAPRADANTLLGQAETLLAHGRTAEACAIAASALARARRSSRLAEFLGRCYMRIGRVLEARAHYSRFLELAPADPNAMFVRAILATKTPEE